MGSSSYGKQFDYDYNAAGQKASETNLAGSVTTFSYGDSWGNLTQVIQDAGAGKLNRTTSVTDGRGTTSLAYEAGCARVKSVTDPLTGTLSYTYLPSGEKKTVSVGATGETSTYTYGYEVNPIGVDGSNGTQLPGGEPDKLMNCLLKIEDGSGSGSRRVDLKWYNGNGDPYKDTAFGYDTVGKLSEVRFNRTFDGGGNLTSECLTRYQYSLSSGYLNSRLRGQYTLYRWKNGIGVWQEKTLSSNGYS